MKYRTKYKESYKRGSRNLSITISAQALELMADKEIDNFSAFLNDLVIEALTGIENFFVRQKLAEIARLTDELKHDGFTVSVEKVR